jgi:hypothetical protein
MGILGAVGSSPVAAHGVYDFGVDPNEKDNHKSE